MMSRVLSILGALSYGASRTARATISRNAFVLATFSTLALMLATATADVSATPLMQTPAWWSIPEQIPDYNDPLRAPTLVAGRNGLVYAFDIESHSGTDYSLMYRTWSLDDGWSTPVDIILPVYSGSAPLMRAALLDPSGLLHVIYFGGDLSGGGIFYTKAYVHEARDPRAWSAPIGVGLDAIDAAAATIAIDGDNRLLIVYAGDQIGQGLYGAYSSDQGDHWSPAELLTRTRNEDDFPASIMAETDGDGHVHLVWHVGDNRGRGSEIRYARVQAGGIGLEGEIKLAQVSSDLDLLGWPSIKSRGDELFVFYQNGYPPTRWFLVSKDRGLTWTKPVRPFKHRGGYELSELMLDSVGNLHLVLGNRTQDPEIHGMWYSRLIGEQWLPLEPIVSGPATATFDPCCPRAVIVQGNILLATWPHNVTQENLSGAWYAYTLLDVPPLQGDTTNQPQIMQTRESSTPTPAGISPEVPTSPTPPLSQLPPTPGPGASSLTTGIPTYVGIVPILLILGLIIARRVYDRS